ncbi:MAG: DUF4238 domain-containing protein, partial [Firmicutes bacterium]|nr:DUF4238 domain-containing protein [Bacillota bacterium]
TPSREEHELAKKFYGVEEMEPVFKELAEGWIKPFEILYFANELKENCFVEDQEDAEYIDYMMINAEEDIHAGFERDSLEYFHSMKDNDFLFLDNEEDRILFSFFTALQFLRTLRNRNAILNAMTHKQIRDAIEKTWNYGKFILANRFGASIYKCKIQIFHNKTNIPFITSDQPVINLDAKFNSDGTPPKTMKLYYPISPQTALCFIPGPMETEHKNVEDYYEVETLNDLMHKWSEVHTFSNYEIMLKKYIEE